MITAFISNKVVICTKYHGPTDTKGSNFSASANKIKVTVPYNYDLIAEENHREAAIALCKKMEWDGELIGGQNNTGMFWVFQND